MLDVDIIRTIDARIRQLLPEALTAVGTVSSIASTVDASVTFDGSVVALPVKVSGDADIQEGDRVCLVKFGTWWVIVGTLTRHWQAHATNMAVQSNDTTSLSTLNDLLTSVSVVFDKRWNETGVFMMIQACSYASSLPCEAGWGVRFTSSRGSFVDYDIINQPYGAASQREAVTGFTNATMGADTYTVKMMWKRKSGTGVPTVDSFCQLALDIMEIAPV